MAESSNARVVMMWPSELKEQVREVAGNRGMTEFTVEAVSIHLGVGADLSAREKELNEVKNFAQQLADQLVLGQASPQERLQSFMELEFPDWIDTSGWPASFAERVRPQLVEPEPVPMPMLDKENERVSVPQEPVAEVETVAERIVQAIDKAESPKTEVLLEAAIEEELAPLDLPHDVNRNDLFARVMAKAGGKLDDVPGLKLASEVEKPAPKQAEPEVSVSASELCPNCGEEMIDGECWTCD